ncbi:LCP family protein [Saccharothrix deserti]|uniref:LCP family protein n=1 Tax=Saccharothrix deserti TaxID=2593674 RepID=UPI00131D7B96|nr:LCP family protein [Saccharothrix deserti]
MTEQEALIREAIAAEADQAVDYRAVLANLHGKRSRRRPMALIAAATLTVVAAAVAVIVPLSMGRNASPPPVDPAAPPATPQTVLLIGLDGETNTDAIVLARVGADGTVSAASLPRDLWVDIPGRGMGRLNSAYPEAHAAAQAEGQDGDTAGAQALVQTVAALVGMEIDHYAAVDMARFASLADAVGGVDVCLKAAARESYSGIDLPAGRQSLNGEQALAFLRQRVGLRNGDLDRVRRHQAFLRSLAAEVAGLDDPAKLARLVETARSAVRTDPDWNLLEFAGQLTPNARTATIPVNPDLIETRTNPAFAIDPADAKAFAAEFFADQPTQPIASPVPTSRNPDDGCVD